MYTGTSNGLAEELNVGINAMRRVRGNCLVAYIMAIVVIYWQYWQYTSKTLGVDWQYWRYTCNIGVLCWRGASWEAIRNGNNVGDKKILVLFMAPDKQISSLYHFFLFSLSYSVFLCLSQSRLTIMIILNAIFVERCKILTSKSVPIINLKT